MHTNSGQPASRRDLWIGVVILAGLFAVLIGLSRMTQVVAAPTPTPTPTEIEQQRRQLEDLQRQADDLGRRLQEAIDALQLRQQMIEEAQAAGTDPYWVDYTWDRSVAAGLNPQPMVRLISWESHWNAKARNENTNHTWDGGLGQTNSGTLAFAASLAGIKNPDPFDPKQSIDMTIAYVKYLERAVGPDPDRVFTAYNRGDAGLVSWEANRGTARSPYSEAILKGK